MVRSYGEMSYFECLVCHKIFKWKRIWIKHMFSHAEPDDLLCEKCSNGFSNVDSMVDHKTSDCKHSLHVFEAHSSDIVLCVKCHVVFPSWGNFNCHLVKHEDLAHVTKLSYPENTVSKLISSVHDSATPLCVKSKSNSCSVNRDVSLAVQNVSTYDDTHDNYLLEENGNGQGQLNKKTNENLPSGHYRYNFRNKVCDCNSNVSAVYSSDIHPKYSHNNAGLHQTNSETFSRSKAESGITSVSVQSVYASDDNQYFSDLKEESCKIKNHSDKKTLHKNDSKRQYKAHKNTSPRVSDRYSSQKKLHNSNLEFSELHSFNIEEHLQVNSEIFKPVYEKLSMEVKKSSGRNSISVQNVTANDETFTNNLQEENNESNQKFKMQVLPDFGECFKVQHVEKGGKIALIKPDDLNSEIPQPVSINVSSGEFECNESMEEMFIGSDWNHKYSGSPHLKSPSLNDDTLEIDVRQDVENNLDDVEGSFLNGSGASSAAKHRVYSLRDFAFEHRVVQYICEYLGVGKGEHISNQVYTCNEDYDSIGKDQENKKAKTIDEASDKKKKKNRKTSKSKRYQSALNDLNTRSRKPYFLRPHRGTSVNYSEMESDEEMQETSENDLGHNKDFQKKLDDFKILACKNNLNSKYAQNAVCETMQSECNINKNNGPKIESVFSLSNFGESCENYPTSNVNNGACVTVYQPVGLTSANHLCNTQSVPLDLPFDFDSYVKEALEVAQCFKLVKVPVNSQLFGMLSEFLDVSGKMVDLCEVLMSKKNYSTLIQVHKILKKVRSKVTK